MSSCPDPDVPDNTIVSAGGWCAPTDVTCACGSTTWPHDCGLRILAPRLDLPAVTVRRGGIQFPPPPTYPTVKVRRSHRRSWGRRMWRWDSIVPNRAWTPGNRQGQPAAWYDQGHTFTARGAARAGRRQVMEYTVAVPQVAVDFR